MVELILHGIGDYFLQTDYQALNKKKKGFNGFISCLFHCITYSILFFFIGSWKSVLGIFISHFIIDRTNIVSYLIAYKNGVKTIDNFGFSKDRPFAVTVWLYIICDNLLHIICNYIFLRLF